MDELSVNDIHIRRGGIERKTNRNNLKNLTFTINEETCTAPVVMLL